MKLMRNVPRQMHLLVVLVMLVVAAYRTVEIILVRCCGVR